MQRLVIEQWAHIVKEPCQCSNQIPGLDAIGCRQCKTWWVDKNYEFRVSTSLDNRKRKK